jgi:hypothetical protein
MSDPSLKEDVPLRREVVMEFRNNAICCEMEGPECVLESSKIQVQRDIYTS